jgi:hypothetical protein
MLRLAAQTACPRTSPSASKIVNAPSRHSCASFASRADFGAMVPWRVAVIGYYSKGTFIANRVLLRN